MIVELIHYTPLHVCSDAIRKCRNSQKHSDSETLKDCELSKLYINQGEVLARGLVYNKIGPKDMALINKIGNKMKHSSTLEHLVYHFDISGISRAVLQEFARHRIAGITVKSSRYTLKELKDVTLGVYAEGEMLWNLKETEKFLVNSGEELVDECSRGALWSLQKILKAGISNDKAKYCMPESYKTELSWTINARSLQNFLMLRTGKDALWEIRKLAYEIFNQLPEEHKYLFTDSLYIEKVTLSDGIKKSLDI